MKFFRRDDVANEIRAHREMLEEQFIREGMSPAEAAAAAHRQFGNEQGSLEESRDQWGFVWLEAFVRDVRFALRQMRGKPLPTATIVLIAGLGVGANTAIVSVLKTVMLKPLGLRDSDRVLRASVRLDRLKMSHTEMSGVEFKDLREMKDTFQSVAAAEGRSWTFRPIGAEPMRLRGRAVTADFFRVFKERPAIGRFFAPEEQDALVLSWQFWKSQFGGDPKVLGRTVMLDEKPWRIVGVAEERFRFPATADAWSSLTLSPERLTKRGYNMNLTVLGRLKDAVTPQQAADRVNQYVATFKSTPGGREMKDFGYFIDLEDFGSYIAGDLRRPLWLLWSAALAVLFTACANIAVLLLSRTAGRRKEIAIRLSLGATRWQIVRQLAVESLLLGAMGGICGIALGAFAISFTGRVAIPAKQVLALVTLDWNLMLYGMAVALASGLIFGLAPATQLLRSSQATAMTRGGRHRFQNMFITAQIATALVLLIATGLLLRSLWTIQGIHPGFDPSNLTTAFLMKPPADPAFAERLESSLRARPGVESAAVAYPLPFATFSGGGGLTSSFDIKGRGQALSGMAWHGEAWFVSPSYFGTLRIPLLRGRSIEDSDNLSAPHVCLIDRKFADQFFPSEEPIGHEIAMYGGWARIVGVVADMRSSALENESRASVYYPLAQEHSGFESRGVIVRSRIPAGAVIREAVRQTNGAVPVFDLLTMDQRIDESLGIRRVVATLVCVFAGICILLATIGLHGVVSQIVGERSGEIAVRMALGAMPSQILRHFLAYGLQAGAAGVVIGLALSLYAERWLGNLLFEVKAFDPATFAEACAGVIVVLSVAAFWPARRASRTQPQGVLRHE